MNKPYIYSTIYIYSTSIGKIKGRKRTIDYYFSFNLWNENKTFEIQPVKDNSFNDLQMLL